ncbi:hypothetical protein NDU88_008701 [Pleurodeles waltl]|uniref:Uncharacterized protein n=1 Tax=Pleurodeles waltl TaxID=8319 RepID=A0AAV7PWX5_PLEWA|nr:hypothetical protein NDU88_008701 [Pleurodeles waltl]
MALECPGGTHKSILPQFLLWRHDVSRDDGVQEEKEEAGTKWREEPKEKESGPENEDYGEDIERNAITETDDRKGIRGDTREKTLLPDCHEEERRAPAEREEETSGDTSHAPGGA